MTRFRIVSIAAVFAVLIPAARAQNLRSAVSANGSDLATCTVPDPCRTIGVAISRTNPGGEVIVLSTGGYGQFTVIESVSIISPPAYYAAITPTQGTAITVNAPGATVILRNLAVNSLGASTGVSINTGGTVHIERLVVNGFGGIGIQLISQSGTARLFVNDSEIRNNGASGIYLGPVSGNVIASIDHVRLESNDASGLSVNSGVDVSVRDSRAVRNGQGFLFMNSGSLSAPRATVERTVAADGVGLARAFDARHGARVTLRGSAAIRHYSGFSAYSQSSAGTAETEMVLDGCLAAENSVGIESLGAASVTVSNSQSVRNEYVGILSDAAGTIRAFRNTVTGNGIGLRNLGGGPNFRVGGHNVVDGNTMETSGTITSVPTI